MFRGDESNRRRKDASKHRKKNARGSSRRLGFEMMESRSLLSATPVSTGPLDLRLLQLNWSRSIGRRWHGNDLVIAVRRRRLHFRHNGFEFWRAH